MSTRSDVKRRPLMVQPNALWTVATAALLGAGGLIQGAAAVGHEVDLERVGGHPDLSLIFPHVLLSGAILCGAWPALRAVWRSVQRRKLSWQMPVLAAIAGTSSYGHFFEAGTVALALSLAMNLMTRRAETPETHS